MWRVSSSIVNYLNEAARNLNLKYWTALTGSSEYEPRWEECTDRVSSRYVMKFIKPVLFVCFLGFFL